MEILSRKSERLIIRTITRLVLCHNLCVGTKESSVSVSFNIAKYNNNTKFNESKSTFYFKADVLARRSGSVIFSGSFSDTHSLEDEVPEHTDAIARKLTTKIRGEMNRLHAKKREEKKRKMFESVRNGRATPLSLISGREFSKEFLLSCMKSSKVTNEGLPVYWVDTILRCCVRPVAKGGLLHPQGKYPTNHLTKMISLGILSTVLGREYKFENEGGVMGTSSSVKLITTSRGAALLDMWSERSDDIRRMRDAYLTDERRKEMLYRETVEELSGESLRNGLREISNMKDYHDAVGDI